jgi:hypothetical protein
VEVWAHKTSLTPLLSTFQVPLEASKVRGHVFLCVSGIHLAPFYDFSIRFWICSKSMVFFSPFYYKITLEH